MEVGMPESGSASGACCILDRTSAEMADSIRLQGEREWPKEKKTG